MGLALHRSSDALCFTSGSLTVKGLLLLLFKSAFSIVLAPDQQKLIFRLLGYSLGEISGWGIPRVWFQLRHPSSSESFLEEMQGPAVPLFNTGLSFAKAFQTKIQRAAVRTKALRNSSSALQMLSNIFTSSAWMPVCKLSHSAACSVGSVVPAQRSSPSPTPSSF